MAQWQSPNSGGPRGSYAEGCIQRTLPTAALPFLQARATGYHVTHVDFTDGSSWPPPRRGRPDLRLVRSRPHPPT